MTKKWLNINLYLCKYTKIPIDARRVPLIAFFVFSFMIPYVMGKIWIYNSRISVGFYDYNKKYRDSRIPGIKEVKNEKVVLVVVVMFRHILRQI